MSDRLLIARDGLMSISADLNTLSSELGRKSSELSFVRSLAIELPQITCDISFGLLNPVYGAVSGARRAVSAGTVLAAITAAKTQINLLADDMSDLSNSIRRTWELFEKTERSLANGIRFPVQDPNQTTGGGQLPKTDNPFLKGGILYTLYHNLSKLIPNTPYAKWEGRGVEFKEDYPGITAWLGKGTAGVRGDGWFSKANVELGKFEANAKLKPVFMNYDAKNDKLFFLLLDGALGASASAIAASVKQSIGNDQLGVESKAEGSLLNGEAGVKGRFSVGKDGADAYLKGKAMVSAAEGKATGTINILGIEIEGSVGGYALGYGVEGKIGIENNKYVGKIGAAALLGGSVEFAVGFNEEGWSDFVDFIIFWD